MLREQVGGNLPCRRRDLHLHDGPFRRDPSNRFATRDRITNLLDPAADVAGLCVVAQLWRLDWDPHHVRVGAASLHPAAGAQSVRAFPARIIAARPELRSRSWRVGSRPGEPERVSRADAGTSAWDDGSGVTRPGRVGHHELDRVRQCPVAEGTLDRRGSNRPRDR
jgi:hypothetical protein